MVSAEGGEPFRLAPIKRVDVFRAILSQLTSLIDDLHPGQRLGSERELAEQLGVSRVSIREALRALESMGKVEIRRNSGTFVADQPARLIGITLPEPSVDAAYLRQVAQVRAAIECAVVRAVGSRPDVDFYSIRAAIDKTAHDIGADTETDASLDVRFELALGRACDNALLAEFQRIVHELWLDAWLRLGGGVAPRRRFHDEHVAILAALEGGDVDRAVALMALHADPYQ